MNPFRKIFWLVIKYKYEKTLDILRKNHIDVYKTMGEYMNPPLI